MKPHTKKIAFVFSIVIIGIVFTLDIFRLIDLRGNLDLVAIFVAAVWAAFEAGKSYAIVNESDKSENQSTNDETANSATNCKNDK